jgi:hypothetical protein
MRRQRVVLTAVSGLWCALVGAAPSAPPEPTTPPTQTPATVRRVHRGAWRCTFNVDGVTVVDSRDVKRQRQRYDEPAQVRSVLVVAGDSPETRDMPHGAVDVVRYVAETKGKGARRHLGYAEEGRRVRKRSITILRIGVALFGAIASAAAQIITGTMSGTVRDELGRRRSRSDGDPGQRDSRDARGPPRHQ